MKHSRFRRSSSNVPRTAAPSGLSRHLDTLAGAPSAQGQSIVVIDALSGELVDNQQITPIGGCSQELTILADVATSKNYATGFQEELLGAYVGDTWGNLWRYSLTDGMDLVKSFGCNFPIHFAPTVVQMDRNNPNGGSGPTYLAQVFNSAFDPETSGYTPSRMVIRREITVFRGRPLRRTTVM